MNDLLTSTASAVNDLLTSTASAVIDHALAEPPLLGGGRMVCVDGLTGSGKSTLAAALVRVATARVDTVHLLCSDDLLDGWGGLGSIGARLRNYVVGPLASGHPARYRRYDWEDERLAEEHVVAPMDLLVLEGVGTGQRQLRSRRATLVWCEAEAGLRLERAVSRDGERWRDHLEAWMREEDRFGHLALVPPGPDFTVDATGRLVPG